MLSDAIRAPTRTTDSGLTLFVGGVLLLLAAVFPIVWLFTLAISPLYLVLAPLAVFPPLIVLGYDLRVIAAGTNESPTLPPFVRWDRLLVDGIRSLAIAIVYLLPPVIVVAIGGGTIVALTSEEFGVPSDYADTAAGIVSVLSVAFVLLYAVLYAYLRPAALTAYAVTGRLRAAFHPTRVLGIAIQADYAVAWVLAAVVLVIGFSVAVPLSVLVVGFFLAFYVRAVAYYLYGSGAGSALLTMRIVDTPSDAAPVVIAGGGPGRDGPRRYRWLTETPNREGGATAEIEAAVQVGRDVPIGGSFEAVTDGPPADEPERAGSDRTHSHFEWGTDVEDRRRG